MASQEHKEDLNEPLVQRIKRMIVGALGALRTPAMRKISIISPTVWFLNEVVYYGTIFNANTFSRSVLKDGAGNVHHFSRILTNYWLWFILLSDSNTPFVLLIIIILNYTLIVLLLYCCTTANIGTKNVHIVLYKIKKAPQWMDTVFIYVSFFSNSFP